MKTYASFAPTGFDARGLALPDRQNWLVAPVSTNRDADALTRSNWEVVTSGLAQFGLDVETHEFGHWACGWFRICLVRPGTPAAESAESWESALADYPVASDDHFSDLETAETAEYWASLSLDSRRAECERARVSKLAAYRNASNLPDRLWERLRDS
jgi:hypothetical protein